MVEGVIQFESRHVDAPPLPASWTRLLEPVRHRLVAAHLIGRDPERYGGVGYGNASIRIEAARSLRWAHAHRLALPGGEASRPFAITSSGFAAEPLSPATYTLVDAADASRNLVVSAGPRPPSSESMTHAAVYAASSGLRCVLHVHDPSFWRAALLNRPDNLGLVEAGIPYGTPAMSHAISAIASTTRFSGAIMAGHDDGWLVWAATPAEALERLDGLRAGFGLRAWAGWPRSRR